MGRLLLKVCGQTDADNMLSLASLPVDLFGLIFAAGSKRHISLEAAAAIIARRPDERFVGVFMDQPLIDVHEAAHRLGLWGVQLHGAESAAYCQALRMAAKNLNIIKVVGVPVPFESFPFREYDFWVDHFLFDTATPEGGGSGASFDWSLLERYDGTKPFFIGGGIGPHNVEQVVELSRTMKLLDGIDINSRVEERPGIKSLELVRAVWEKIQ